MQPTTTIDTTDTLGTENAPGDFSEIEELSREEKVELLKLWKERSTFSA